jgi:hypothetical protein
MKLDLKRPTLVLAGAWNPAIFQPGWIAHHVFGEPVGAELTMNVAQQRLGNEEKIVIYIDNVGFTVSLSRVEIFAARADSSAFDAVENAAAKILELLPHTPVAAYGINFFFIEEHPSNDLAEKIRCRDGLERRFSIVREAHISRIDVDSTVQLNLQRLTDGPIVAFDFNFHRGDVGTSTAGKSIHGEIDIRLMQALDLLDDVYGLSGYDALIHDFDATKGTVTNV